jgi:predicted O-methyltransferase YrrM
MPISLSRRQVFALSGIACLAVVGILLTMFWQASAGVVMLLVLQVLALAGLVLFRREAANAQRAMHRQISTTADAQGALHRQTSTEVAGEVARLRSAVDKLTAESPVRELLESAGRDRLDAAARFTELGNVNRKLQGDIADVQQRTEELRGEINSRFLQTTSDAWFLHNLLRLVDISGPYPAPGGRAVTPNTLVELVSMILDSHRDLFVVECGSGASTVWIAHCHRAKGGEGRLIALEHDSEVAGRTRAHLERLSLERWAEVRNAPLVDLDVNGQATRWYDPQALIGVDKIDILLVNRPSSQVSDDVHYPAFAMLAPKLAPGGVVVLDDVTPEPENPIAHRWVREEYGGLSLSLERRTDRAQIFRVIQRSRVIDAPGATGAHSRSERPHTDRPYDTAEIDAV